MISQTRGPLLNRAAAVFVIALASFNIFLFLDSNRVEEWDEARRGVAAYEMMRSGNYVVNTYRGEPDYWSVKPPLTPWLISLSYRIFGTNRFALRFPAALAALLSIAAVLLLAWRLVSPGCGLLAGAVLATTFPYICDHSARAGENDAPLAFLILLAVAAFEVVRNELLFGAVFGTILALVFLLKSFSIVLPAGIIGLLLVLRYRRISWKGLLVLVIFLAVPVSLWAIARYEADGTRYLAQMFRSDLIERTTIAAEGHDKGLLYYFGRLIKRNTAWSLFIMLALFPAMPRLRRGFPRLGKTSLVWLGFPLLAATLMKTRVGWYINPVYPPLAILAALVAVSAVGVKPRFIIALFTTALLISEVMIMRAILGRNRIPPEEALLEMASPRPGQRLFSERWPQHLVFVAEVEKRLECGDAQERHGLRDGDLILVGKDKVPDRGEFDRVIGQSDDLVMLEFNGESGRNVRVGIGG